jgi:GT2 family glycosyltransferase
MSLKTRLYRAAQLLASGELDELAARLKRKVQPKGDLPEAMDDPAAYARWLRKQEKRFAAEREKGSSAGAEAVSVVFVGESGLLPALKRAPSATLYVREGDELDRDALRLFSAAFARGADVVTCDEDRYVNGGRASPRFKPVWSPERLLEDAYALPAFLVRDSLLSRFEPPANACAEETLYALLLHVLPKVRHAEHLPLPLVHLRKPLKPQSRRVHFPVPPKAFVSIMIPFRDQPALLERCLRSLFAHTERSRFELLLIDNGSKEAATRDLVAQYQDRARVLYLPGPFNFAALNNRAAEQAKGSHLLLLNNDTEIIHDGWLESLVALADAPGVGAVGCKLLYADRTLQHAGVWLGVAGLAAHAYAGKSEHYPGHHGELGHLQNLSAVTGACLMVGREKWRQVSGMDEHCLKVAFNDLDLCLRLEEKGYRTVYTPHVTLIHHESKSRGPRVDMTEERAFMQAHRKRIAQDPYVNPNFSRLVADGRWR